jgi:NapC/NirT cytochrome c family, N-terminal region
MARDVRLIRSPISIAGMVLTTVSAVLFLVVFIADVAGLHTNPYVGIVFLLVLPALFILGLILIPLGAWRERRRRARGLPASGVAWPLIDLNEPRQRSIAVGVFALTLANIVIVSLAAYGGVEYMDSVQFCGQLCHVMRPELMAHQASPHAQILCVDCHVGTGARSFIRSKLAGSSRVVGVTLGTYARPILAEPEELLSAVETCERCHWPSRPRGDLIRKVYEYADDEKNTESATTLTLHVGSGGGIVGVPSGIHWHMNAATVIEYVASDAERQTIPYVRMTDNQGVVREYVAEGGNAEDLSQRPRRRMDCMDCHNRPSHAIPATPERAVNLLMTAGTIPKTLPFVHREAVKALKASHASQDEGLREISRTMGDFYRTLPVASDGAGGDRDRQVGRAVAGVQEIFRRSVFREMNVSFGTYANNIGHIDSPGCFRCHDENHKSKDGQTIRQDCETCHSIQ